MFDNKSFFFALNAPSIFLIIGSTASGKSYLIGSLLDQFKSIFTKGIKIKRMIVVYSTYQQFYHQYAKSLKRQFPSMENPIGLQGLTADTIAKLKRTETWKTTTSGGDENQYSILVLDDVSHSLNKEMDDFFEVWSHHQKISRSLKIA